MTNGTSIRAQAEGNCLRPQLHRYTNAWLLVLVLCLLSSSRMYAQAMCCSVSGRVVNTLGEPIGDARVNLTRIDGRGSRTIVSAADGTFAAREVPPGKYVISTSYAGATAKPLEVTVAPGSSGLSNLIVQLASGANAWNATGAVTGSDSSSKVRDIPLNGRSATDVATLEPGVSAARTQASGSAAQRGFGAEITILFGCLHLHAVARVSCIRRTFYYLISGLEISKYLDVSRDHLAGRMILRMG